MPEPVGSLNDAPEIVRPQHGPGIGYRQQTLLMLRMFERCVEYDGIKLGVGI